MAQLLPAPDLLDFFSTPNGATTADGTKNAKSVIASSGSHSRKASSATSTARVVPAPTASAEVPEHEEAFDFTSHLAQGGSHERASPRNFADAEEGSSGMLKREGCMNRSSGRRYSGSLSQRMEERLDAAIETTISPIIALDARFHMVDAMSRLDDSIGLSKKLHDISVSQRGRRVSGHRPLPTEEPSPQKKDEQIESARRNSSSSARPDSISKSRVEQAAESASDCDEQPASPRRAHPPSSHKAATALPGPSAVSSSFTYHPQQRQAAPSRASQPTSSSMPTPTLHARAPQLRASHDASDSDDEDVPICSRRPSASSLRSLSLTSVGSEQSREASIDFRSLVLDDVQLSDEDY